MVCLQVPEILLEIFEFAFALEDGYPNLAALARTCHAFYDPAVSLLWRTQSSLAPLVLCFPSDLLDISRGDSDADAPLVTFAKTPCPQDWERPLRYAELIRAIGETPQMDVQVKQHMLHSSVLATLVDSCPVLPLFRRLEELDHSVLSSSLRWVFDLSWRLPTYSEVTLAIASLLELSNPVTLRELKLAFWMCKCTGKDAPRALLMRVVEHHATIESLDIVDGILSYFPVVDQYIHSFGPGRTDLQLFDYLIPIGSLQKLTSLTLSTSFDSTFSFDLPPKIPVDTLFPAILELILRWPSSAILQTLKVIHSPNLRAIRFNLSQYEDPGELCRFITSRAAWGQSLQSISITSAPVHTLDAEYLLGLRHLRHVSLNCLALDDNMLQRMAQAWPALEHLDLTHREYWTRDSGQATLNSVASFCRLCPCLTYLQIKMDASLIPLLADVSETETSQGNSRPEATRDRLHLVIFPSSKLRDPVAVAQFLSNLSPRITLSIPNFRINGEHLSSWKRVVEIMQEKAHCSPRELEGMSSHLTQSLLGQLIFVYLDTSFSPLPSNLILGYSLHSHKSCRPP
ncbi:hypothetical protein JVU11DRAFT_6911 [Chiua virens]|nr:hypothetical protein JVU11DRAFT_6911 [Chiua virens]